MAKPAIFCANMFISHLKSLELTRQKGESLMSSHMLVRRDIEQIYKGLWLDAVCSFEQFIEQLFIGLLVGSLFHPSRDTAEKSKMAEILPRRRYDFRAKITSKRGFRPDF